MSMINTIHKIIANGERYNFEVVSEDFGDEVNFHIRATSKTTRRTSCINNLNTVLSELLTEYESKNYDSHPEFYDSTWVVSKSRAKRFIRKAKNILSDSMFVTYLENNLDEDRYESEWENIITENHEIDKKKN